MLDLEDCIFIKNLVYEDLGVRQFDQGLGVQGS